MTQYQEGDSVTLSREGKVFVTQYQSFSGFTSLTRVLGPNPKAEVAAMQATLDVMFRDSLRRNILAVNECYEAAGAVSGDVDICTLLEHLEAADVAQGSTAKKPARKTRRVKKPG